MAILCKIFKLMMYKYLLPIILIISSSISLASQSLIIDESHVSSKPTIPNYELVSNQFPWSFNTIKPFSENNNPEVFLLTDSLVSYNSYTDEDSVRFHKTSYTYNDKNLLTSIDYFSFNEENNNAIHYKTCEYLYNKNFQKTAFTQKSFDFDSGLWHNELMREYSYQELLQLSAVAEYSWDISKSEWLGLWKYEYTYNSEGYLIQKINYEWLDIDSEWLASSKEEFIYNSHNKCIIIVSYYYSKDQHLWIGDQKYEYEYDNKFNLIQQTDFFWDLEYSTWTRSLKTEFEYNIDNTQSGWQLYKWNSIFNEWTKWWRADNLFEKEDDNNWIDYQWNINEQKWEQDWRIERYYDPDNTLTHETAFKWDKALNEYSGIFELLYFYNNEKWSKAVNDYEWDLLTRQWQLNQKRFYYQSLSDLVPLTFIILDHNRVPIYNAQISLKGNLYQAGLYHFPGIEKGNLQVSVYTDSYPEESFILNVGASAISHIVTLGINTSTTLSNEFEILRIYPNPAQNYINLEASELISRIRLYSIDGTLLTQSFPNSKDLQIAVGEFPAGLYLLETQTDNKLLIRKILIDKH